MDTLHWFQQKKRRVKESLLQAIGSHEGSYDNSFDHEVKKFHSQVNDINSIREAMQLWSDAMDNMCSANLILAEAFTNHLDKGIRKNDNKDDIKEDEDITTELLQLRNTANTLQNMCKTYNDNIKNNIKKIFSDKCLFPTNEVLSIVPVIEHKLIERQGLKLDFDNYTAKLKTDDIKEDEEKHKRNQIKLQKATAELDNMTSSILECMDEFDGSKHNLLSTEFASAFACIYHFTSSSSCLMARLLPNIPMAASTLCSLYEADNILKNDSKYLKPSENKSVQEKPTHSYDLLSIFNKKSTNADDITHINLSNAIAALNMSLEESHPESHSESHPPVKPPKRSSIMVEATETITVEADDTTESLDSVAEMPMRRGSMSKQKGTFRMNSGDDNDDTE